MNGLKKIILFSCVLSAMIWAAVASSANVYAQGSLFESLGVQAQMIRGESGIGIDNLNYLFGVYTRNGFNDYLSGELGASVGVVSGIDFRARVIPVDYRLNVRFSRRSPTFPYVYFGIGMLFHKPLEVPANDPFTQEMGPSLANSSLWDFEGGVSTYVPLGMGLEIPLESAASLDLQFGYQQSLQIRQLTRDGFNRGYWGLTVGVRFSSGRKPASPTRRPDIHRIDPVRITVNREDVTIIDKPDLSNFPEEDIDSRVVQFEINSTRLDAQAMEQINWIVRVMESDDTLQMKISGHTDPTGMDIWNDLLSESRAQTVWLELVERGVDATRIDYQGFSDRLPVADNRSGEGRAMNRRANFELIFSDNPSTPGRAAKPEGRILRQSAGQGHTEENISPDYSVGTPLFYRHQLSFRWMSAEPVLATMEHLRYVSELLKSDDRPNLMVVAYDDFFTVDVYRREVSKARAQWIKAWLITQGIDPGRLTAYWGTSLEQIPQRVEHHLQNDRTQQVILIPHDDALLSE